jgi:two-component system cell cycle sensor histidine kinase PleC
MEPGSQTALTVAQSRGNKLALAQLGHALRGISPNCWLRPALGLIICLMFEHWVGTPRLIAWFVLVAVGAAPLAAVTLLFNRRKPQPEEARSWTIAGAAAYALFALSWSSMGFFLWAPGSDLNHLVIMLLLACTVGGNSALVGAFMPFSVVAFATYGSALVLTPLLQGGSIYNGLSALAALFLAYLVLMARQVHRTAANMLSLREDKDDLIAELAAAKAQAETARERAVADNLAKSHFLADMGHDLRTPLNAILGFSEMIFTRTFKDPEKHYEYAELIHGSGQNLLSMINDILDLAKIEAGRFQLREAEIDLGHVIEDAIQTMSAKAEKAGCALTMEVEAGLPPVFADERALRQVLLNLLSNAIKFTPNGGCAMVFACAMPDGAVHFGVADTGVGVPDAIKPHLFENFRHGRREVVSGAKGAGLGLPIVHGLMAIHGGSVSLESTEGEGTRVTAVLPANRARSRLQAAS